jgi:hypothetical protein
MLCERVDVEAAASEVVDGVHVRGRRGSGNHGS